MRTISPPVIDLVTARLKALADPTRIKMLLALQAGPSSVQGLAELLGNEHRSTSYNINILFHEGIVTRHKDGKQTLYTLADFTAFGLLDQTVLAVSAQVEELADTVLPAD